MKRHAILAQQKFQSDDLHRSELATLAANSRELATQEVAADLAVTEATMDRRRARYLADLLAGRTTRARTTTFNAEQGKDAQRRDDLRRMLKGLQ